MIDDRERRLRERRAEIAVRALEQERLAAVAVRVPIGAEPIRLGVGRVQGLGGRRFRGRGQLMSFLLRDAGRAFRASGLVEDARVRVDLGRLHRVIRGRRACGRMDLFDQHRHDLDAGRVCVDVTLQPVAQRVGDVLAPRAEHGVERARVEELQHETVGDALHERGRIAHGVDGLERGVVGEPDAI